MKCTGYTQKRIFPVEHVYCIPYVKNILQQQNSFNNKKLYSNDLINKVVMIELIIGWV